MTDRIIAGPEARVRVQKLSQKELQSFFDEISAPAMRPLAPYLPQVDGFRRGSPAGIVKQMEVLARRLSLPTANEQDFKALYMVWRAWIDETQSNAPLIQSLIDELEEAADKADGAEARRIVIEQHTDSLLQKLKEESEQNRSQREGIERLYTFSPLPETSAAHGFIVAAKLAADVARDTTYRNLPTRLEKDEREIQSIKAELKVLADRVAAIAHECTKAVRELPGLRDSIRQAQSAADTARAAAEKANKQKTDNDESSRAAAVTRLKTLADDVGALRKSVSELTSNLDNLKQTATAVRHLGDAQDKSAEEQKQFAKRIDQIVSVVEDVRRNVDALLEQRTQPDGIAPLAEKIGDLAQRVDGLSVQAQPSHEPKDFAKHGAVISGALRWTSLPLTGDPAVIPSCAGLATAFSDALLFLGMRKSSAQLLAEECAAGIAARQAIFLQGAFASRVAQALAAAAGGAAGARLAMPIGILDGGQLRLAIEEAFASLSNGVGGLAIEGINHVPCDLIREIIADCVGPTARPNAPYRRIAIFATLSRGIASLSVEPEILELGPIFDLDYLDWRTNASPAPPPRATVLPAKTDQLIFAQLAHVSASMDEAVHLAQALAPKRNPAVERNIVRAYQALHMTRSEQKTVTPLHSLFYGWLLPYWRALGVSREQVDSEFDGGKVHGAPPDGRLAAMFAGEFPESKKGKP
jgi:hypothetical protein